MEAEKKKGKVYLIGAGPGDPDLITIKGKKCIQSADVIVYDYLSVSNLLEYAKENAEIIYVGKKGSDHTLTQDKINQLLVDKALAGKNVARLKGGDPFIFGRGGEEAIFLIENKISFEIVSGVTSAIAAPAYAGIPLTHRDLTSTLAFVTGHENPEKKESSINWDSLSKGIGTIVFLMGVKNLHNIVKNLIDHGKPENTPIALVRWGTKPQQRTVTGTLLNIVQKVKEAGLKAPCITVVGEVVNLRKSMEWFEKRPLMGKKIIVTRARHQASQLVENLTNLGAECLSFPTIEIIPPEDYAEIDKAIESLSSYKWIIFTSVNGVVFFFKRLFESGYDVRALNNLKTASIGPATAEKLLEFGLNSDIVPKHYRAESVIDAFSDIQVKNVKILLPRAGIARPILPVELRKMGALVDEITVYNTVIPDSQKEELISELLSHEKIDMITFTSSSTVTNFKNMLVSENFNIHLLKKITMASIGPITTETAKKEGFDIQISAETFTIQGLCDSILKYYQK